MLQKLLGAFGSELQRFEVNRDDVLGLFLLAPIKWAESLRFFEKIWAKLPEHKYGWDKMGEKTKVVMERLIFPENGAELFYGLEKRWMPLPTWFVLFPVLRYVPLECSFSLQIIGWA